MNDPSSDQRPAVSSLLTPTETSTLKKLWLREKTTVFRFNEFQLNGIPESLKTFVDQFLKEDGLIDSDRLVWTSENSFARVGYACGRDLPGVYQNHEFGLMLISGSRCLPICIHSTTLDDAMSCIDFLTGLHDDHYKMMTFYDKFNSNAADGRQLCPLTSVLLRKMILQNAKRKTLFNRMTFTPDQSRTLATSGTGTDIELHCCKFQDDGEAFLEALAMRADPQTGLTKLSIVDCLPFAEGILVLHQHQIESLTLNHIRLESEEGCRAVAEAQVQHLVLQYCKIDGDGGASLVESIREGRGPKGLDLYTSRNYENDWHQFDSSERFTSFLNALRGNSYLERLVLSEFDFRQEGILDALAAALFENKGLIHLGLRFCHFDESGFCKVLRAISTHSSLCTLDLTNIDHDMDVTEASEEVAKVLSVNSQLEEIRMNNDVHDSSAWAALVTPRLECNVYRKRFAAIQEIRPLSTRAAVLTSALAHVSNRPSPAYMLLRLNGDILSSYPLWVESQIATSSEKRSRSPSLDGMVV
jgi:hypothetical protein